MDSKAIKSIEVDMLIEVIYRRYGYDFSQYSRASLIRRIEQRRINQNLEHISELIPLLLYEENQLDHFIFDLSVSVTEMFRDPTVYSALVDHVFPILATYPRIKIWHAGCATGEEVYSLAILLEEANLYHRTLIYATDINQASLETARKGIYPAKNIQTYCKNYHSAGGRFSLSNYYHEKYENIKIDEKLKKNIIFSNHNLVHDASFSEMQLILCRNVLIYFNSTLQQKVLSLFHDSLSEQSFICLGVKESMSCSNLSEIYELLPYGEKIYRQRRSW